MWSLRFTDRQQPWAAYWLGCVDVLVVCGEANAAMASEAVEFFRLYAEKFALNPTNPGLHFASMEVAKPFVLNVVVTRLLQPSSKPMHVASGKRFFRFLCGATA